MTHGRDVGKKTTGGSATWRNIRSTGRRATPCRIRSSTWRISTSICRADLCQTLTRLVGLPW